MKLTKTGKYHISKTEIKELLNNNYKQDFFKPRGFWYSIGSSWLDWKLSEEFNNKGIDKKGKEYYINKSLSMYKVKFYNKKYTTLPDDEKVLLIDTYAKLIKFNKKYLRKKNKIEYIDWNNVSSDYAGIEFRNFNKIQKQLVDKKIENIWHYTLDVDSGCIWRPSKVIKHIDKMT
tara:strand:- start:206 stop:730 length:525 start_codon:yes stop_codon:yes gene_type:complete